MSHRNPTFIIKNGEGSSYLFRTIIPKEIRCVIQENSIKSRNSKEIRISLLTGLKSEAIRLAQLLKIKADLIYENIRSGNISGYCVKTIKVELKAYLYQIRFGGHNGEQIIEQPRQFKFQYYHQPMERKLTEDYIRCLKFEDFERFCIAHDIEFKAEDYSKKGLQLKRAILSKKVDEEIGYHSFASGVARDILNDYLPNLGFEDFRDFFNRFDIDDDRVDEILNPLGDMSVEQLVSLLEEEYDVISIARKIGVKCLFAVVDDVYENDHSGNESDSVEKLWNGLKSGEKPSKGAEVSPTAKSSREQ